LNGTTNPTPQSTLGTGPRSELETALGEHLALNAGNPDSTPEGADLAARWLREEALAPDVDKYGRDGVELVITLILEDHGRAQTARDLWGAARALYNLVDHEPGDLEKGISLMIGDHYVTWSCPDGIFVKRSVVINEERRLPSRMRHWFEKAGIGRIQRDWASSNFIFGETRRKRFTKGTMDGRRNFRVLPHLDRIYICDGNFDRWANSTGASVPMPRTEREFMAALDELLRLAQPNVDAYAAHLPK
jgi:hypothetical protein